MAYVMTVQLDDGAKMPTRAHILDAGLDLYSREEKTIPPRTSAEDNSATFDTGVHILLPPWHYGKIEGKSGLMVKHNVCSLGGVIDEGYTGSIIVKLFNMGTEPYTVHKGDKIAQLIIQMYTAPEFGGVEFVTAMPTTDRGADGFGSTGR